MHVQCHTYCSITDRITRAIHILVLPAASMQHFKAPPLSGLSDWIIEHLVACLATITYVYAACAVLHATIFSIGR